MFIFYLINHFSQEEKSGEIIEKIFLSKKKGEKKAAERKKTFAFSFYIYLHNIVSIE
jgi:hypothetical protein